MSVWHDKKGLVRYPFHEAWGAALPTDDPSLSAPGWLERTSCILVGVIAGGAGGYVAFERSNQLGSGVLLVIGAVFLVIGIQGTRLMRFSSGSNIVELEQKKRIIADAIEKAAEEGNPEKASGIAEGAAIASPKLGVAPQVVYELQVASAIIDVGYLPTPLFPDRSFDLRIQNAEGNVIYAEIKRYSRPVPPEVVEALIARTSMNSIVPVILITYTELSKGAQEVVNHFGRLEIVQWRNENDNAQLAEALRRIFASIPRTTEDD
jgi:Restriction endonuclease